jgi:hypothetical protein
MRKSIGATKGNIVRLIYSDVGTICLLAVGWQSWKAATRNPVEALKYK